VSGWARGAAAREQALVPVTTLMLDMAGVTSGSCVIDLGAGTGDQTVAAARRVGPDGSVLATDLSAVMLDRAREAAGAVGLQNVTTRVLDMQQLDLPSASFHAAFARFSLQFVPDVQRALAEVRRVLKPGGRFAAVVFSSVEQNPFRAMPQAIASRLVGRPFPEPGPGQWALNAPDELTDAFGTAGFREVSVQSVPFVYRFETLEDAVDNLKEAQPMLTRLLAELDEPGRAAAWAGIADALRVYVGQDGFAGPSEALVAVGTA